MSIEITPEMLADIESKANAMLSRPGTWGFQGASAIHAFQSAANPAAVLAMIERIRRLESAQCWVIVNKETKVIFLGPFFTEAHANDKLGSMPFEYAKNYEVQTWKGGAE